jgi:hypothetical protein
VKKRIRSITSARWFPAIALGLALLAVHVPARAQPVPIPPTWGGDLMSRPRGTGDWFGLRDELGKKGIVFDVDLLLTPQGVATGGRDTGADFWGNADLTLNVDTKKLGLWPGGFVHVWADTGFGQNVFKNSAVIVPVNTAGLIPAPNDQTVALMNATFDAVRKPEGCGDRGQDLSALFDDRRIQRQLPHAVYEYGTSFSHGSVHGAVVSVRQWHHRPPVGESSSVWDGAGS